MFRVQEILPFVLDHAAHVTKSVDYRIRTDFGPWAQGGRSRCQPDAPLLWLLTAQSAVPHEKLVGRFSQDYGAGYMCVVPAARRSQVQQRLIAGFCPGTHRMLRRGHADPVPAPAPA